MSALLVLAGVVLSFVLAGCEAALLAVSRVRVRHAANERDKRAQRLLPLIEDRDALLGAVTVTNHIAALTAFLIIASKLADHWGWRGYAAAFVIGLPVFLVGLEIVPKKLFRRYPFRMLRQVLPVLRVVGLFRPLFGSLLRRVLEPGERCEVPTQSAARDDLRALAKRLTAQEQLSPAALAMIGRVLDYRRLCVGDVMVTLRQSVALAPDVPVHVAVELARSHGLEAVPVLGENGAFEGVFEPARCGPQVPEDRLVRQHMRDLEQARDNEPGLRVLQRLRKRGRTVALVAGKNGEAVGVVTEQGLLRPLLGSGSAGAAKLAD